MVDAGEVGGRPGNETQNTSRSVSPGFSTFLFDFEVEEQEESLGELSTLLFCRLFFTFIWEVLLYTRLLSLLLCCSSWIYHHRLETDLRHVNRVNKSNYNTVFYLSPITSTFRSWNVEEAKHFFHHNSKPSLPEIHRSCR